MEFRKLMGAVNSISTFKHHIQEKIVLYNNTLYSKFQRKLFSFDYLQFYKISSFHYINKVANDYFLYYGI